MARLFEAVRQVRIAVADTQETKKKFGYVHCNADQIKQGMNNLVNKTFLHCNY